MKKLLFTLLLLPCIGFGQKDSTLPIIDGKVVYTETISIDGISKEELYKRAKLFFADNYKSAKSVINFDDSSDVRGTGTMSASYKGGFMGPMYFTIKHSVGIKVKDGKFRYEISQLGIGNSQGYDYYSAEYVFSCEWVLKISCSSFRREIND